MRPGNYAHEKWAEISPELFALKMHARNKHLRLHKPDDGSHWRDIIITKAQADLYDNILELRRDDNIIYMEDLVKIKFNIKSLERLIYNKIIKIENNKIILI